MSLEGARDLPSMDAHVTVKYTQRFGPGSGWAESLYHTVYLRRLDASSVIVDLGASLGFFSREMNELFACRCHAVEALPENYALIEESSSVIWRSVGPTDL